VKASACILVNPVAGRGVAAERLESHAATLAEFGISEILKTKKPGDEAQLTVAAIDRGFTTILVVGGDGTCSRVAETILESGSRCALAVLPCGTGNDIAKTLGVDAMPARDIARLVAAGTTSRMDVGRVERHSFLNSLGFGFVASVLEATQHVRFLKGDAVYIYSALAQLFTYRGLSVSTESVPTSDTHKMLMLTVSNGRFLGGAFRIAPNASAIDGQLDFGFVGDSSVIDRIRLFAGAFQGTHLSLPTVKAESARAMTLRFSAPPMMEVDGELRQALSSTVKIECVPRALNVIAAPGYPV
jgi:YegS/Rv2252/BmrU family lipid kinase